MPQASIIHCPHCGTELEVTPEYIAQYGGKRTHCVACGGLFDLPGVEALRNHQPIPPPPFAAVRSPPVLAYALPSQPANANIFASGNDLVMAKNVVSPARCVKCNAPAAHRWSKTLYWHNPGLYILILFPGLLIYAIVALCVRKSGRVTLFLCPAHAARRRRNLMWAWMIALAGVASIYGAVWAGNSRDRSIQDWTPLFLFSSIVLIIGGIVCGIFASRVVSPRRIDDQFLTLRGAGQAFLSSL